MRTTLYCSLMLLFILVTATCKLKPENQSPPRKVAIIKFTTHPALDETEAGIKEAFIAAQQSNPDLANVTLEYYNANGNPLAWILKHLTFIGKIAYDNVSYGKLFEKRAKRLG